MPFRYQLQKVLDLIERKEKEVDAKVMAAAARRDGEQAKLDEIDMRKNAASKGLSAQMAAGATPDVAASNDYIQMLGQRKEQQQRALVQAEKDLEAVKEIQTQVRRERSKLEKHREMKLTEYQAVVKKKEAQRIDEMAGTIFMKRRNALEEENAELADRMEKLQKLKLLQAMREKREKENRW
jgi:flagellar export protein FliJ